MGWWWPSNENGPATNHWVSIPSVFVCFLLLERLQLKAISRRLTFCIKQKHAFCERDDATNFLEEIAVVFGDFESMEEWMLTCQCEQSLSEIGFSDFLTICFSDDHFHHFHFRKNRQFGPFQVTLENWCGAAVTTCRPGRMTLAESIGSPWRMWSHTLGSGAHGCA